MVSRPQARQITTGITCTMWQNGQAMHVPILARKRVHTPKSSGTPADQAKTECKADYAHDIINAHKPWSPAKGKQESKNINEYTRIRPESGKG